MVNSTLDADVAAKELRRWMIWLGGSMLGAALFTALALSVSHWMILPAIIVGPGIGGLALIWLALSSDTNGTVAAHGVAEPRVDALAAAEPTV